MSPFRLQLFLFAWVVGWTMPLAAENEARLLLHARSRSEVRQKSGEFREVQQDLTWDPHKTALVVCDMWDQHWCRGASRRVAEMAPRMNEVIVAARNRGVLIVHCPSGCMDAYRETPQRALAQAAPRVETAIPLQAWCKLDAQHEGPLPIDDSDGGCDCWPPCPKGHPWTRQIAAIEIQPGDAVTDSAEAYYLMKQRGIENVIVMGVHANMCVLGRPFSIRQLVYQGQNVVLMRDMTDTMYNSRMSPQVTHVHGTQLVVEHIEKYWCPTVTSTDLTGKPAFQFAEASQPHVVFLISEPEYATEVTLPVFAREQLEPRGLRCTILTGEGPDFDTFPGIAALKTADLLLISVRRRALPNEQLQLVRDYLAAGKPLVGIRTACHAFHTRGKRESGHAEWQEFDPAVLGGNYTGHYGEGPQTKLSIAGGAGEHLILRGVKVEALLGNGSLYKVNPLAGTTQALLMGEIRDQPSEPIAWTNTYQGGRVFYTTLGHKEDFRNDEFNRLLVNGVFWALNRPVPEK